MKREEERRVRKGEQEAEGRTYIIAVDETLIGMHLKLNFLFLFGSSIVIFLFRFFFFFLLLYFCVRLQFFVFLSGSYGFFCCRRSDFFFPFRHQFSSAIKKLLFKQTKTFLSTFFKLNENL